MYRWFQEFRMLFASVWGRRAIQLGWIGLGHDSEPPIIPIRNRFNPLVLEKEYIHRPLGPQDMTETLEWDHLYLIPRSGNSVIAAQSPSFTKFTGRFNETIGLYSPPQITPVSKRILDLAVCIPLLVLLSPLLLLIAILVKIQDGGPIFFKSVRVGKDGVPFDFYKFRTMVVRAESLKSSLLSQNLHGEGITFKIKQDPRITRIGRVLRRWSLDELPQLWNVLIGDMSLVGPRPAVPEEVARYRHSDQDRLKVIPGLTCIWQISGRSEIPFERQVEMDREYIQHQSLWLDLQILVKTLPAIIHGKGAY